MYHLVYHLLYHLCVSLGSITGGLYPYLPRFGDLLILPGEAEGRSGRTSETVSRPYSSSHVALTCYHTVRLMQRAPYRGFCFQQSLQENETKAKQKAARYHVTQSTGGVAENQYLHQKHSFRKNESIFHDGHLKRHV